MSLKRKERTIQLGDRFFKVGKYNTEWIVKDMIDFPDLPPHLHIAQAGSRKRGLTFSVSALMDRRLFCPSTRT